MGPPGEKIAVLYSDKYLFKDILLELILNIKKYLSTKINKQTITESQKCISKCKNKT